MLALRKVKRRKRRAPGNSNGVEPSGPAKVLLKIAAKHPKIVLETAA
jgi:hypothetical protein